MPAPTTSVQSTNLALTRASFWDGTPHTIIGAYKAGGWTSQSGEYSAGYSWWLGYRFAGWGDKWITTSETTIDSTKWIWIAHTSTGSAGTCHFFEDGAGSATSESAGTDYTGADLMVLDGAAINRVSAIFVYDHVLTAAEILAQSRTSVPLYSGLLHHSRNDSDAAVGVDSGGGSWSFSVAGAGTTVADAPTFPDDSSGPAAPVLTSTDPADEETDVDPTTTISLTYDGDIDAVSGKNVTLIKVVDPGSPTVPATNTDAQNTNATTFVVDVPAVSTPAAGTATYVIIGLTKDANSVWSGTWPPTGWNVGVVSGQTSVYHAIIWRRYTSSASATTFSLTQSSDNASSRAWVVEGGDPATDPVFGTPATAASTAPNPTSLAPSWNSEPMAAGYYVSIDGNITSYTHPTGWTANGGNATTTDGTTTNRVGQAYSHNTVVTGTIDAGALTITSGRWIATHWAVRPFDPSELIETIAADSGQVVITDETAVITPTDPLPASSRIRVLADEGAFEADGGSAPSAAIVAGMLEFLTGAGSGGDQGLGLAVPSRRTRSAGVSASPSGAASVSLARPPRAARQSGLSISALTADIALAAVSRSIRATGLTVGVSGAAPLTLDGPSRALRSAGLTVAPAGSAPLALAVPPRVIRSVGLSVEAPGANVSLSAPARSVRPTGLTLEPGVAALALAEPARELRSGGLTIAPSGTAALALSAPLRALRRTGLGVSAGSGALSLSRPARLARSQGVAVLASGSVGVALAGPARRYRRAGLTASAESGTVALARPSRSVRGTGLVVAPSGAAQAQLSAPARVRRSTGLTLSAGTVALGLAAPSRRGRLSGLTVSSGAGAVALARPARQTRSGGVLAAPSGYPAVQLSPPLRRLRQAGLTVELGDSPLSLSRPGRTVRGAGLSTAVTGSAPLPLARPARQLRRSGVHAQGDGQYLTLPGPSREYRSAGLTLRHALSLDGGSRLIRLTEAPRGVIHLGAWPRGVIRLESR